MVLEHFQADDQRKMVHQECAERIKKDEEDEKPSEDDVQREQYLAILLHVLNSH